MSTQAIRVPPPEELAQRIRACREELAALRKLFRIAQTVVQADEARARRMSPSAAGSVREGSTCS